MGLFIRLSRVLARMRATAPAELGACRNNSDTGNTLRHSLARQSAVFASALDGILILDAAGRIENLNPAAEALFGYVTNDAAGLDVSRLISLGGDPNAGTLARLRELATEKMSRELVGWHRDGVSLPVDLAVAEMPVENQHMFALFVRDLRERRRNEQLKDEFVATVSHELRTPLTSISGSLGLLAAGAGGVLPENSLRLIRIAHANSQRLVRLVNDILDIEKIESGQLKFMIEPVPVRQIVEQVILDNRGFADGFNVSVALDPASTEAQVEADPDRLTQAITNLLSNAIKFSPPGGEVDVRIERHNEDIRISVRDHGDGIPEEFRDRIFEKFAQADGSDARHKGGTGLGLSIVQQIMIRMNGDVGFDSTPGVGSVFYLDLPAQRESDGLDDLPSIAPLRHVSGLPAEKEKMRA